MKICLEGITLYAPVGCTEIEQKVGNHIEVDVELDVECDKAAEADELNGSINYVRLYEVVKEQMMIPTHILENAAYRIAEAIYSEFGDKLIRQAKIKISKMAPPVGGKVAKAFVEHIK